MTFAGPRPNVPDGNVLAEHEKGPKTKTLLSLRDDGDFHWKELSPIPISLGQAFDGSNTIKTRERWPCGVIRSKVRARQILQQIVDIVNAAGGLDLTENERNY